MALINTNSQEYSKIELLEKNNLVIKTYNNKGVRDKEKRSISFREYIIKEINNEVLNKKNLFFKKMEDEGLYHPSMGRSEEVLDVLAKTLKIETKEDVDSFLNEYPQIKKQQQENDIFFEEASNILRFLEFPGNISELEVGTVYDAIKDSLFDNNILSGEDFKKAINDSSPKIVEIGLGFDYEEFESLEEAYDFVKKNKIIEGSLIDDL